MFVTCERSDNQDTDLVEVVVTQISKFTIGLSNLQPRKTRFGPTTLNQSPLWAVSGLYSKSELVTNLVAGKFQLSEILQNIM